MSYGMQKPENALKRAQELLHIPNVDDAVLKRSKRNALEILHEALVAKKFRTWQPLHEELMRLYLDICMELQLGRIAKDGLHQYRNLSIATNPASLETIIAYFVAQTERKLAGAKQQSDELILQQAAAVDLEAAQTPEAVMLSTTSFDSSSDRTDREVVVPWLRFTWETYRTVLDILKNNSKLETLYKNVTLKAFDFCVEYTRKIEFRRLCEILRNHLGALQKHSSAPTSQSARQMRAWDGFTIDTVEKLLEVRYRQLQVATQLELFSEAFRTIDDINNIMNLVDQVPRLDLMVTYYEKLAQIFLVSKNFLFHAYALYKFYALRVGGLHGMDGALALKALKPLVGADEQHALATRVVLAALSVPLVDFEPELANESDANAEAAAQSSAVREKNARMAALLGYATTPSRAQLLDEIEQAGILAQASPAVASIFQHVERAEVDPLQIVAQVAPSLATLRDTPAASYVDAVERLVVRRVLFQLTRVYSSVTIAHLKSLLAGLNVSYQEIEQLIVRSRSLSTVAHASAPSLTSLYQKHGASGSVESSTAAAAASALRTKIRIDHVQQCIRFSDAVELEANPAQLTQLGERLTRVLRKVNHSAVAEREAAARKARFASTRESIEATRAELVARREIIERKKEELERLQQEKIKSLEKKRQEYEQARAQLEKERLEAEAKRREAEKKQKIKDEIALKETKQMLDKLGRKDLDNIDLETIDREALINEAKEKAQKAKEDAQRKLKDSARRLDYIIRATREAEQPIIQKQAALEKETAKRKHEQDAAEKLAQAKEAHAFALTEKARLAAALPVATGFIAAHVARRQELYKKTAEEQKKKATLARLEKRVAHAKERYEDEQARIQEEREEEERRRREEEEERERARQAEIDAELRRQEEDEEENRRREEEEQQAAKEREREAERERESGSGLSRFGAREGGAYRPPSRRSDAEDRDGGDWKSVGPRAAPEGRWDRSGPVSRDRDGDRFGSRFGDRDGPREGGLRRSFGGDREGSDRFGGDRDSGRFGGDRAEGGGLRRAFGGDRDAPREGGLRRAFGGDRDGGDREGGSFRRSFGGDRDGGDRDSGSFRRSFGGDREGDRDAPREGGLRRAFGGDREGGDRFGARREGGDDRFGARREGGDREGGAYRPPRGGDREQARAPDSGRWR